MASQLVNALRKSCQIASRKQFRNLKLQSSNIAKRSLEIKPVQTSTLLSCVKKEMSFFEHSGDLPKIL